MTWFGIGVTYLRFHAGLKAQGFDRTKLPYYHRMQPFAGWYTVIGTFFVSLVSINRSNSVTVLTRTLVLWVLIFPQRWMEDWQVCLCTNTSLIAADTVTFVASLLRISALSSSLSCSVLAPSCIVRSSFPRRIWTLLLTWQRLKPRPTRKHLQRTLLRRSGGG